MSPPLQLTVHFERQESFLSLVYQVVNRSDRDAYLLNRLYRELPLWQLDEDVIYAQLDPATKTLWLNKKLADIPEGVYVTAPVAPFVTPLRKGETCREEVRIPLPVEEYLQYGRPSQTGAFELVETTYESVFFTLGYYWSTENTTETAKDIHGTQVVIPSVPQAEQPLHFGELVSERIQLAILVKERREIADPQN